MIYLKTMLKLKIIEEMNNVMSKYKISTIEQLDNILKKSAKGLNKGQTNKVNKFVSYIDKCVLS